MKKILFVGQFPPPRHGVSVINELLSKELCRFYDVSVYDYRFSSGLKEIGKSAILPKLLLFFGHLLSITKMLVTKDFDIFYFTPNVRGGVFFRDLLVVMAMKCFRGEVFLHLHGLGVRVNSRSNYWRFFYRLMFRGVHVVHVSEKVLLDEFGEGSFGERSLNYLNNSIDLSVAHRYMRNSDEGEGRVKNIVHMSNFRPSKGVMDVLKVYEELKEDIPCRLKMIGSFTSEKFEEEVRAYINEAGLGDVEFLGFLESDNKISALESSDLFIYPSYDDSFGLVVLEAQSVGLPVVCYDIGSMKQIVNTRRGAVCELGDIGSLNSATRRFIKGGRQEPDLDFLKDYDIASYASRLSNIMEMRYEG